MARRPKQPTVAAPRSWWEAFFSPEVRAAVDASQKRARRVVAARKAAETRRIRAAEKRQAAEKKVTSGLRKRARDVLLDILDRVGRADWPIVTKRSSERAGAAVATAVGGAFWPDPPIPARYDRTVRALSVSKADRARIAGREANVRAEHLQMRPDGKQLRVWETVVALTEDPHALILSFDAKWEEIAAGDVRHGVDYGGPVITIEVYFVEHRK